MSQSGDFEIRFTDREITAWGGMALMRRMLESSPERFCGRKRGV